jgi:hypothetical protein
MNREPNERIDPADDAVVYVPYEDIRAIERAIDKMERAREEICRAAEEINGANDDDTSDENV